MLDLSSVSAFFFAMNGIIFRSLLVTLVFSSCYPPFYLPPKPVYSRQNK